MTTQPIDQSNPIPSQGSESPRIKRLVALYENGPLATSSTGAVPRLLSQLLEWLATTDEVADLIAISPGGSTLSGVENRSCDATAWSRAVLKVRNNRIARRLSGPIPPIQASHAYHRGRAGLMQLRERANNAETVILAATMTGTILARECMPRAKVVYWIHGMPRLGQERLASQAVSAADAVVASSHANYRDLFALICRDRFPPPIWVIPNPIDREQFATLPADEVAKRRAELGLDEDAFAVMHVGRAPEKGLAVMRAVLASQEFERRVVLLSAGGPAGGRYPIGRNEIFEIGKQPPEELNALYQSCQLGVVPSVWWENCPLALVEMMSLGLCPIGSQVGGIPEMIDHEVSGLLVPTPNDVSAWGAAIGRLMSDSDLRERLAAQARQSASEKFSRELFLHRWQAVLSAMAAI